MRASTSKSYGDVDDNICEILLRELEVVDDSIDLVELGDLGVADMSIDVSAPVP